MTSPNLPKWLTLAAVALLAVAGPATAVFVETPLLLESDTSHADVGDTVYFRIAPGNEDGQRAWAGKTVKGYYGWDANEGTDMHHDPDESVSNEGQERRLLRDDILLDANATGSFEWIVPEEVQDRNVLVTLESEDGEHLASLHLAVGDATPVMYTTGIQDDGREIDTGAPEEGQQDDRNPAIAKEPEGARNAPGPGLLALVGMAAVAGIAAATGRRRR